MKNKILKTIGIILLVFFLLIISVAIFIFVNLCGNISGITKLDEDGSLYYAEYTGNYYKNGLVSLAYDIVTDFGCSAFSSYNENREVITCRNFDYPHFDGDGNLTGLNVILRCEPEGKYKSLNIADAALLSEMGLPYYAGTLDKGGITELPLTLLPFLCMDGINEKGLCASILFLDTKEDESVTSQRAEGKERIWISQLIRYILDSCATLDEAITLSESYNLVGAFGCDYHLFVSDIDGNSAVFEWRYNTFTVTYTDAVTNFYVSYDDAADFYENGVLSEKFEEPEYRTQNYRYGFGHGYKRFNILTGMLETHTVSTEPYKTQITEEEAKQTLIDVSQEYSGGDTSFTQYSIIYNNTQKSLTLWSMMNYDEPYVLYVNE